MGHSSRKYKSHRDRERDRHHKYSNHRNEISRSRSRSKSHSSYYRERPRNRRRDRSYKHRHREDFRRRERREKRARYDRRDRYDKYDRYDRHDRRDRYASQSYDGSESRSRSRSPSEDPSRRRRHEKKYERSDKHRRNDYSHDRDSVASQSESSSSSRSQSGGDLVSSDDGKDRSKDADHFKYKEGYVINDRYRITKHLGDGTFGRVLEVEDVQTKTLYAMKVIRAVKRYVESAQTEMDILEDIKRQDPEGKYQIVRLETAFLKDPSNPNKEQNFFMVFEKLGMSLYDYLKRNNYEGFEMKHIQAFARQILSSIGFMHSIHLTHTDLKPENVLLANDESEIIKYSPSSENEEERSSTRSKSEERIHYKPKYDTIKIIDMGGATYDNDHHSSVINTRQYRAPEVILACCPWNHESDVWSIGCILIELYTGDLFFETHENLEHLAMIDKACGPIPYWMANRAESKFRKCFTLDEKHYEKHKTFYNWPENASGMQSIKRVQNMRLINDVIPSEYPELRDLLKKMLTVDPKNRITCQAALEHDFFKVQYGDKL